MSNKAREGFTMSKATDEDDVEGHAMRSREGFTLSKETEGDDVEGHAMRSREGYGPTPGEGVMAKATGDEDDVEGHGFNRSPSTRGE